MSQPLRKPLFRVYDWMDQERADRIVAELLTLARKYRVEHGKWPTRISLGQNLVVALLERSRPIGTRTAPDDPQAQARALDLAMLKMQERCGQDFLLELRA